jgi:16S rRNA (guanine1516-N2)-methyltransferase
MIKMKPFAPRENQTGNPLQGRLTLDLPNFLPLFADFTASSWDKRKAAGKKQGLIRACKPAAGLYIVDATAGWGRDAAVLSRFGAKVLMLERHPVMAALLQDALMHRSETDKNLMDLHFLEVDAKYYLNDLKPPQYPDVIYIDPMHPERSKAALVKKDMQALQKLIGTDEDALELIQCAMTRAKQRVVVKWPHHLKPLLSPSFSIDGKTIRFDVYT